MFDLFRKSKDVLTENGLNLIHSDGGKGYLMKEFTKQNGKFHGKYIAYNSPEEVKRGVSRIRYVNLYNNGQQVQTEDDKKAVDSIKKLIELRLTFQLLEIRFSGTFELSILNLSNEDYDLLARRIAEIDSIDYSQEVIALYLKYKRNYILYKIARGIVKSDRPIENLGVQYYNSQFMKHLIQCDRTLSTLEKKQFKIEIDEYKSAKINHVSFEAPPDFFHGEGLRHKYYENWIKPSFFVFRKDWDSHGDWLYVEVNFEDFKNKVESFSHVIIDTRYSIFSDIKEVFDQCFKTYVSKFSSNDYKQHRRNIDAFYTNFTGDVNSIVNNYRNKSEDTEKEIESFLSKLNIKSNDEKTSKEGWEGLKPQIERIKKIQVPESVDIQVVDLIRKEVLEKNYNPALKEFRETEIQHYYAYEINLLQERFFLSVLKINYDYDDFEPIHVGLSTSLNDEYVAWDITIQEKNEDLYEVLEVFALFISDENKCKEKGVEFLNESSISRLPIMLTFSDLEIKVYES